MKPKIFLTFFLIILVASFFRLWKVDQDLLFHYDQGLHATAIWDIWKNRDFALLGHPTDVEGIYHGSFFYHFMIPAYALSGGDPVAASVFLIILDLIGVFLLFHLGKTLFKNNSVGLIATGIWGVSFLSVSYSRWLSNVTVIPFFAILFYLLIAKIFKERKKWLWPPAAAVLGIITQLNGAIGFFFIFTLLVCAFIDRRVFIKQKLIGLASIALFLLPVLPLIIFETRHDFLVTKSILRMIVSPAGLGFSEKIVPSTLVFAKEFVNLFFAGNLPLAVFTLLIIVIGIFVLLARREFGVSEKLILIFILVPVVGLLLYKRIPANFFFIGILPAISLLSARSFTFLWSYRTMRSILILFSLLFLIHNIENNINFFSQPSHALIPIGTNSLITLEDRKRAVDFIYSHATGQPFGLWIYTIPYFKEEPWSYVFLWHGKSKYGYLPSKNKEKLMFTLWERDPNEPGRLIEWQEKANKELGKVVVSAKFHDANVERRIR